MDPQPRQPRYLQVIAALRADAVGGVFGARLPGENELALRYAVSRMTLRRAISALVEEGVLDSRHGAGTFLRDNAGQSRVVGLVVADDLAIQPHDCFHQQLMLYLLYAASRRGWTLRVAPSVEDLCARLGAGRSVAMAACIAVAFGGDASARLPQIPLPLVTVDGEPVPGAPAVLPDSAAGIAAAVARLVQLGHREIVHLAGAVSKPAGRERIQGYLDAMAAHGLPLREHALVQGGFLIEDGYAAARRWWAAPVRPTALLCANDMMALGALRWFGEQGVAVGREVSVIGVDGLAVAEVAWPCLATIALDFDRHADAVMDAVTDRDGAAVRRSPMALVERASLGPAPAA